jgi:hypothetical protein
MTPLFWYSPTRFSKKLVLPLRRQEAARIQGSRRTFAHTVQVVALWQLEPHCPLQWTSQQACDMAGIHVSMAGARREAHWRDSISIQSKGLAVL